MGKHVGNFIKVMREKRGLSQGEVARLLSLKTAQSISNIERGVSPLPRTKIKKLADVLGVKKADIVTVVMRETTEKYARSAGAPQVKSVVLAGELSPDEVELIQGMLDKFSAMKKEDRGIYKKRFEKLFH